MLASALFWWVPDVSVVSLPMLGLGLARPGEYVVVVAGSPPNAPGATNTLRVHQLGTLVDPSTV